MQQRVGHATEAPISGVAWSLLSQLTPAPDQRLQHAISGARSWSWHFTYCITCYLRVRRRIQSFDVIQVCHPLPVARHLGRPEAESVVWQGHELLQGILQRPPIATGFS